MTDKQFQIGDYVVEPLAGLVRRSDGQAAPVHLQPKVMKVLCFLAEHPGDVIRRDELINRVWGRPVTDDVLTRAIHELRAALDDRQHTHRYIETIPKIGYRLLEPVAATTGSKVVGTSDGIIAFGTARRSWKVHVGWFGALIGAALVVFAVSLYSSIDDRGLDGPESNYRVVLAGFENFTEDPRLESALGVAFRTGLEQSPRIVIFPPALVASALERMRKDRNALVDRETAIEVSLREDVDAVIVGTISSVGGLYRLSGEIIEPETGRTVFSHQSDVVHEDKILQGLDKVVTAIRQGSGETQLTIDQYSLPLEKVTTANFEALEAYSIGMQKFGRGDIDGAIPFLKEAIRLDSAFAMAYAKLGFMQAVASDVNPEAVLNLEKSLEYRDRLTRREQLYVSALVASFGKPAEMKEAWSLLIHSFPQYAEGYRMLGSVYMVYDNDFENAADQLARAVQIPDPMNAVAHANLAMASLGMSRYEDALKNARTSWENSQLPMGGTLALVHISMRNYSAADEFLRANLDDPSAYMRQVMQLVSAISYLDQGKFEQARAVATMAETTAAGEMGTRQRSLSVQCAILERLKVREPFLDCLRAVAKLDEAVFEEGTVPRRYWPSANLAFIGIIAARNGHFDIARTLLETTSSHARQSGVYPIDAYSSILEAEILLGDGEVDKAMQLLQPLVDGNSLFQSHETLARAYILAGDEAAAIEQYTWLIENRGQAFAELVSREFGNEFHILDWVAAHASLGQLYEKAGMPESAIANYKMLLDHWANADDGIPLVEFSRSRSHAIEEQLQRASRQVPSDEAQTFGK